MSKRPLFSCVMPVKGDRPYMKEALESLVSQGLSDDLEVIIQDADVEPDQGQSDAFNKGFAKARGEWLFWLNADDVLLPGVLAKIAQICRTAGKSCDWVVANTVYLDKDGVGQYTMWNKRWHGFIYRYLTVWSGGPSAFFRRELFEKIGGFDISLKYVMDIDLWTRMAKAGFRYKVVDFPVWGFRCHEGSLTASGKHRVEHEQERVRMLEKLGVRHLKLWRNVMRCVQLLDGSYLRRILTTRVVKGKHWKTLGV